MVSQKFMQGLKVLLNKYNAFDKTNFWASNVRNVLYTNGFGDIWESQNLGIDKSFFLYI